MNELMEKLIHTHTHTHTHTEEYYMAFKKKVILPFVTIWMNMEGITLSEISYAPREKCWMISLICGIEKKLNSQKQRV